MILRDLDCFFPEGELSRFSNCYSFLLLIPLVSSLNLFTFQAFVFPRFRQYFDLIILGTFSTAVVRN